MTDLSQMIEVSKAIAESRWKSRIPDSVLIMALARTVLFLGAPHKELKLAPSEAESAKLREREDITDG